jgi:hypothetical protein
MAQPFPGTVWTITDASGNPVSGAKVYTYAAGTLTAKAAYTTAALTIAASNPIIADSSGRAQFFLGAGAYRVRVFDANDVELPAYACDNMANDVTYEFNQAATGGFFVQNGARVNRMNDRIFLGGATANDGRFPNVAQDWFTQYQVSKGLPTGAVPSTIMAVLNDGTTAETGAVAQLLGIQSRYFNSAGTSAIASSAYVLNNNPSLLTNAWAFYGEAHKVTAGGGSVYGMELDTLTMVETIAPTPYQQGDVIGIQIASGAELDATGQFDASAAIQIAPNPKKWKAGINFLNNALSTPYAIQLAGGAVGHAMTWFNSSGGIVGQITSTNTTSATQTNINFNTLGLQITGNAAQTLGYFLHVTSAANYFQFSAATATNPPTLDVGGSDTNIDLRLAGKGTGAVRFGTYTAGVVTQAGYVEIKDSGGTVRRLLVG